MASRSEDGEHALYDLVYVKWRDHQGSNEWQEPDAVCHEPTICHSIGWRLKEDETGVTIFGSIADSGQVGNLLFVAREGIERLVVQKKAKRRTKI